MKSTRRGSFSVHRSEKTPGPKYSSTSGLSPRGHLERQAEFHASTQDEAGLSCPQSAGTLRSESAIRGTLLQIPPALHLAQLLRELDGRSGLTGVAGGLRGRPRGHL